MLWLLYVSYLVLRKLIDEPDTRVRFSAVFGLFAFLDIPLVYFSNRIFRTQHPPPVIAGGPDSGLDPTMAKVLLLCMVAFVGVAMSSLVKRYRLEELSAEVDELRMEIEDGIETRSINLQPSLERNSP